MPDVGSRVITYSDIISFPTTKPVSGITYSSVELYPFEKGSWDKAVIHMSWSDASKITNTLTVKPYASWDGGDSFIQIGSYSEFLNGSDSGDTYHVLPFCPRLRIDVVGDATSVLTSGHGLQVNINFYETEAEKQRHFGYDCVGFGDSYASFGDTKAIHFGTVALADGRGWGTGDTGDSGYQTFRITTWLSADSVAEVKLDVDTGSADSIVTLINDKMDAVGVQGMLAYALAGDTIGIRSTIAGENVWFSVGDTRIGDSDAILSLDWTADTYWGSAWAADAATTLATGIYGDTVDLGSSSVIDLYVGCVDRSKIADTIDIIIQHSEDASSWRNWGGDTRTAIAKISSGTGPSLIREKFGSGDTTGLYRYVRARVTSASGDSNAYIASGHGCYIHIIGTEK